MTTGRLGALALVALALSIVGAPAASAQAVEFNDAVVVGGDEICIPPYKYFRFYCPWCPYVCVGW